MHKFDPESSLYEFCETYDRTKRVTILQANAIANVVCSYVIREELELEVRSVLIGAMRRLTGYHAHGTGRYRANYEARMHEGMVRMCQMVLRKS